MNMDPILLRKELGQLILYLIIAIPVLSIYLWLSRKARKEWLVLMGEMKPKGASGWERRRYVRLDTVFPVEFRKILDKDKIGRLNQAFTRDVSKKGISIEIKVLRGEKLEGIVPDKTKLQLMINMPLYSNPVKATGTVRWVKKLEQTSVDKYAVGVSYDSIADNEASRILKYALWLYRRPVYIGSFAGLFILIIIALLTVISGFNAEKKGLRQEMQEISHTRKQLLDRVKNIEHQRQKLAAELRSSQTAEAELRDVLSIIKEKETADKEVPVKKEAPEPVMVETEEVVDEGVEQLPEEELVQLLEEEIKAAEAALEAGGSEEEALTLDIEKAEDAVYKKIRDHILKENIQLLERYCSRNKSSRYHAAALFALAELRYKHANNEVSIENAYENLIDRYPRSKYATYSSHRLEQLNKNLPYEAYSLRYFYSTYNLPPLFDYREIEPYEE